MQAERANEKASEESKRRKQAKRASEESKRREQANKTSKESKPRKISDSIELIYEYLSQNKAAKTNDIAAYLGLSAPRTRAILAKMEGIEAVGTTTNRRYRLKA